MMNIDPDEDPEQALIKAMGITGFNTTKVKYFVLDLFNLLQFLIYIYLLELG